MNKAKNTSQKKAVHEAQFILFGYPRASKISKEEMLERMRTFPERAARFLEKFRADKEVPTP